MNTIKINEISGKIEFNGVIIGPLDIDETRIACKKTGLNFLEQNYKNGWIKIMANINICDEKFGMNIDFYHNKLNAIWFSWIGGIVEKKGYSASESDLIRDKNTLSNVIRNCICKKNPDIKEYNKDIYNFDWGYISSSASIQSTLVSMGIEWKSDELTSAKGALI